MAYPTLESAFAAIASDTEAMADSVGRLRQRFQEPHRFYHNEQHTLDVLARCYEWPASIPSPTLVAAALFHDAIYDPTRSDNEAQSAELCRVELTSLRQSEAVIRRATDLIEMTAHHLPATDDTDAILLADADLHVLGGTDEEYECYRKAVRAEYAHVPDNAWRTGRVRVMERFLERPRIYHGDWSGVASREEQARRNLAVEICTLKPGG